MRSLYIIFGVLICGVMIVLFIFNNPSMVVNTSKSESPVWEVPVTTEVEMITTALKDNYIKECIEFYVSQTAEENYLVACSDDGSNWTYYLFNKEMEQLQLLNKVQSATLTSPDLIF